MKNVTEITRRMFGWTTLAVFAVSGQAQRKRLTEEDEWADAYELSKRTRSDRPKDGFVPNAEVAERMAEVVLSGLYGKETAHERPFRARLRGNVWTVIGSLPPLALGGVAIIQIAKDDGRILFARHTQ